MGSFARAARRTGNLGLSGVVDALRERENRLDQEATYDAIRNAYQNWKQGQDRVNVGAELKPGGRVTNPFAPTGNEGGIGGIQTVEERSNRTGASIPGFSPTMRKPAYSAFQERTPQIPETQTRKLSQKEQYEKALANKNQFDNVVAPLLLKRSSDPEIAGKISALSGLAGKQVEQLKPKAKKGTQIDPFKTTGYYDDEGNFVVTREADQEPVDPADPIEQLLGTVGSKYGVTRQYGYKTPEGNVVTKEDFERTNFDSTDGDKDKDRDPDISKLLGETAEGIRRIKDLKKAEWIDDKAKGIKGYQVKGADIGMTGKDASNIYPISQEEMNMHRDKIKQKYIAPVIEATKKRELTGPGSAIEIISNKAGDIQADIDKIPKGKDGKRDPKEVLKVKKAYNERVQKLVDAFIKANPDYIPDKELLQSYYELLSL